MRICIVYDCLFPWTVGGAERWYRNLAERLALDGHEITYLTRLQWADDQPPVLPGIRVLAVSPDEPLYGPDGNRRIGEALRFGWGVLKHLARHGRFRTGFCIDRSFAPSRVSCQLPKLSRRLRRRPLAA